MKGQKLLTGIINGKREQIFPPVHFVGQQIERAVLFVYVMKETNKHYHLYAPSSGSKKSRCARFIKNTQKALSGC